MAKINVQNIEVGYQIIDNEDYICLTDMAKQKDGRIEIIIQNWMRNRMTIEFLGLWEKINNPNFNHIEFDVVKVKAGLNSFYLTPTKWIEKTNAIGIITKKGRYGGTYAHKDIAFEFASWLSPEFKLYLIKEFDRLKNEEQKLFGWDIKRNLAKINYRIHTDAIKENLIPEKLSSKQINIIYANEADVLNMALFGMTAKEWRDKNPDKDGNIRDYADVNELVCLSNLENINSIYISERLSQKSRLIKLNEIAISQMKILTKDNNKLLLNNENKSIERIEQNKIDNLNIFL